MSAQTDQLVKVAADSVERDYQVIEMNREALAHLDTKKTIEIVPGATHLIEEGALEEIARLAGDWFTHYLIPASSA